MASRADNIASNLSLANFSKATELKQRIWFTIGALVVFRFMELTADSGKGYVPAVQNRPVDAPIGLIPVDSLYSPIKQVSYKVGNARVGQELDYDNLSITVETDGTVTPEDAVAYAARILQDQLSLFVHFEEGVPLPSSPMIGMSGPGIIEPLRRPHDQQIAAAWFGASLAGR